MMTFSEFEQKMNAVAQALGYTYKNEVEAVQMADDHKVMYLVTENTLIDDAFSDLRKEKKDSDVLDTVMLLSATIDDTQEKFCLVFLNDEKDYRDRGIVQFVDITDKDYGICSTDLESNNNLLLIANIFFHDIFPGEGNLKYDMDEDVMDQMDENWFQMKVRVPEREIEDLWIPSSYIDKLPPIEGYNLVNLVDKECTCDYACEYVQTSAFTEGHILRFSSIKGKLLTANHMKSSLLHYELSASDLFETETDIECRKVAGKFVVVSLHDDLNPTLIDAQEEPVYIPCDDFCILGDERFDNDYLISELRKDYVSSQLEPKSKSSVMKRDDLLQMVKIYVPKANGKKSSLDLQKEQVSNERTRLIAEMENELAEEREKHLREYKDVCRYVHNYPKHRNRLLDLLEKMKEDEIANDCTVPNEIRKILEWIRRYSPARKYLEGIFGKYPLKGTKGYEDYNKMSINKISRMLKDNKDIPIHVQRSFHSLSVMVNDGSHDGDEDEEIRLGIDSQISTGQAPYLTKMMVYELLNILYWCTTLQNKHENK